MGVQALFTASKEGFALKPLSSIIITIGFYSLSTPIFITVFIVLDMQVRKIAPVVRKVMLKDANDEERDLEYWLTKQVKDRAAAVTYLISQALTKGQRMDKTRVVKKSLKL